MFDPHPSKMEYGGGRSKDEVGAGRTPCPPRGGSGDVCVCWISYMKRVCTACFNAIAPGNCKAAVRYSDCKTTGYLPASFRGHGLLCFLTSNYQTRKKGRTNACTGSWQPADVCLRQATQLAVASLSGSLSCGCSTGNAA